MDKLELTDDEAEYLLKVLKFLFKKYSINLGSGNRGKLNLKSNEGFEFIIDYHTSPNRNDKMSIHIREKKTNLSLARVNIDPKGFHLNSDGNRIKGNRILLFSGNEWVNKNDGSTFVKAFNLPDSFKEPKNLEQVFLDFLAYINVKEEGKVKFPSLF